MNIPETGADELKNIPTTEEAYITNPFCGKEYLTPAEAIDAINMLSGMLLVDSKTRKAGNERRIG